ncbi:heat-labile enterotoxin IIB A chain [Perkinsela sp. CCAP 1560/4]|nr:heat-labile enterotoxin IIB A chain [Perkinsela sp. CCAP 1560/4]|eukprot:KNH05271.1 heat-labile enterotoxin IIB A chain [Perkinsela sp. CCAP 1560/4]
MLQKDTFTHISKLAVISALGYVSYLVANLALRKFSGEQDKVPDFTTRQEFWRQVEVPCELCSSDNESEWLTMDEDDSETKEIDSLSNQGSPADDVSEDLESEENMLTMALMELLAEEKGFQKGKSGRMGSSRRKRALNAKSTRKNGLNRQTLEKKATVQEMQMLYEALSLLDGEELENSATDMTSRMEIIDSDGAEEEI